MNTQAAKYVSEHVWLKDLEASRDLNRAEKIGFTMVLKWFDNWRQGFMLEPGEQSARQFWRAQVKLKPREPWQLDQWAQAFRWYLRWCEIRDRKSEPLTGIGERVKAAVYQTASLRGLAKSTKRVYADWASRYAKWVVATIEGDERAVMDEANARSLSALSNIKIQASSGLFPLWLRCSLVGYCSNSRPPRA